MDALGGRLFESDFCDSHSGQAAICTRSVDCSVRSLWRAVQVAVDQVLSKATLRDLLQNEEEMNSWVRTIPGTQRNPPAAITLPRWDIVNVKCVAHDRHGPHLLQPRARVAKGRGARHQRRADRV